MELEYSKKDMDEIKYSIEKTVKHFLGFSEPTLVTAALSCLNNGYDKNKTTEKLSSLLDVKKAERLSEKIFDSMSSLKIKPKVKRKHKESKDDNKPAEKKPKKDLDAPINVPVGNPSPGQLTAIQIQEMMANAQKMIEERKKAFNVNVKPATPSSGSDSKSRIAALSAQINSRMSNLSTARPNLLINDGKPLDVSQQNKPTPLILNEEGRTIDSSGNEIQLTHYIPSLKANIRAQKREQFKIHSEKVTEDLTTQGFFDPRVSAKTAQRVKRGFKFHEKGKFEQLAQTLRSKAQLENLRLEVALAAKKTGITSATKLALIVPKKDIKEGDIPNVEWWDSFIMKAESYEAYVESGEEPKDKLEGITNLIEHPIQMKAPTDPKKPVFLPVFLTKKEKKKLRRQNRRETWKEKQEKIRLGLDPPPEPKVRMSNLMRVLGNQAVQDPTKIEAHVREQMIKRQRAHEEANAARKLTVDQKRAKKIKKIKEDVSLGCHVAVYRVLSLLSPAKKFKVEMNCKQLHMTGCVVLYRNCNIVVVEGGPKQQKKFKRLMLNRIKWGDELVHITNATEKGTKVANRCLPVWEGTIQQRNFGEIKFKVCPTESFAREFFKKYGVEQYWDLSYSMSILEATEDT